MPKLYAPARNPLAPVEYEHTGSYSNEIWRSAKEIVEVLNAAAGNELPHAAFSWEGADSQWEKGVLVWWPTRGCQFELDLRCPEYGLSVGWAWAKYGLSWMT